MGRRIFSFGTELPVGDSPLSVTSADFDGDGNLDLAVVATEPGLEVPAVRVFLNLGTNPGDLSFAPPITYSLDASPNFLATTPPRRPSAR